MTYAKKTLIPRIAHVTVRKSNYVPPPNVVGSGRVGPIGPVEPFDCPYDAFFALRGILDIGYKDEDEERGEGVGHGTALGGGMGHTDEVNRSDPR